MMYLVEFHRGFSAFNSPEEIVEVISQEVGIRISTCETIEHAYVAACKNYAWKEWERGYSPVSHDLRIGKRQDSILLQVFR